MSMVWSIVKKQQDLANLRDYLVVEPAKVGFKLSAGCPCLVFVVVAEWVDAFSTPKRMQGFGVAYDSLLQLLPHCRAGKCDSDAVLELLLTASLVWVSSLYKGLVLKLLVEDATLINIEDVSEMVSFADLW